MAKKSNTLRPDGRIQSKVFIGIVDGKKKYKYVYGKTQKEVNQKVAELKVKLGLGVDVLTGKNKTLEHWIDLWLESVEDEMVEDRYNAVKARLKPFKEKIGKDDISAINTADIQRVIKQIEKTNPRTGKPTSKKTLTEYRNTISRVFNYAIQNRVISFNPTVFITINKSAPKNTRKPLSNDEISKIRNTPDTMRLPSMLMMYAGLRRGEACALTPNDIDLENNIIHITKSYDFKEQKIKTPKTDSGIRDVPIINILHDYLAGTEFNSFLVVNDNGKPYTNGRWLREWERYTEKLGIKTTAHCLRHTFVTLMYEAGVDEFTTKEVVGHSCISTTREIYTHLRDNNRNKSLDKLNKYLLK